MIDRSSIQNIYVLFVSLRICNAGIKVEIENRKIIGKFFISFVGLYMTKNIPRLLNLDHRSFLFFRRMKILKTLL